MWRVEGCGALSSACTQPHHFLSSLCALSQGALCVEDRGADLDDLRVASVSVRG